MNKGTSRRNIFITSFILAYILFSVPAFAEFADKVIIVVNDEVVTQREFDRAFEPIQKGLETQFAGEELVMKTEAAKKGLMDQLVNVKLAVSLAKKDEVEVDETEVAKRIEKIKSYYKTEEEFLQALSAKGTNLTEFEKEIRDQMLAQKLVQKEIYSKIVVTPKEVRELYEKNESKFVSPTRISLRGIMVRKGGDDIQEKDREKMAGILKELDSGRSFAAVALEESEGPYAKNSGGMGWITRGHLREEIEDMVFALKKGERTEVIETPLGLHIFTVDKIEEERPLKLEEVSDFLENQLTLKKFQEDLAEWIREKKKNAYICYK